MRYLCRIFTDHLNQAESNVSLRHTVSNSVSGSAKKNYRMNVDQFLPKFVAPDKIS